MEYITYFAIGVFEPVFNVTNCNIILKRAWSYNYSIGLVNLHLG